MIANTSHQTTPKKTNEGVTKKDVIILLVVLSMLSVSLYFLQKEKPKDNHDPIFYSKVMSVDPNVSTTNDMLLLEQLLLSAAAEWHDDDLVKITKTLTEPGYLCDYTNLLWLMSIMDNLPIEVADKLKVRLCEDIPQLCRGYKQSVVSGTGLDPDDLLNLDLPLGAYNALMNYDVRKISELTDLYKRHGQDLPKFKNELLRMRNIGLRRANEIIEKLKEKDYIATSF